MRWFFSKLLFKRPTILRLQPGDVLVLKVDEGIVLSEANINYIKEDFCNIFPENRLMIIEGLTVRKVIHRNIINKVVENES